MKIKIVPAISEPIYLQSVSLTIAGIEGDIPQSDQVWVKIRQATEADHIARADLLARRVMTYGDQVSETVEDNPRERLMYEVYWTLAEVGNLVDEDGKPIFSVMPAKNMPFAKFQELWGKLSSALALAIHAAVRQANPDWDFERGKA